MMLRGGFLGADAAGAAGGRDTKSGPSIRIARGLTFWRRVVNSDSVDHICPPEWGSVASTGSQPSEQSGGTDTNDALVPSDEIDAIARKTRRRIYKRARSRGLLFDDALRLYAYERLVHRMTALPGAFGLALRGAWAIEARLGVPHRRWTTLEIRGPHPAHAAEIPQFFMSIDGLSSDGLCLASNSLRLRPAQPGQQAARQLVKVFASLAGAEIPLKIEFTFADPADPAAEAMELPTMLNEDSPTIPVLTYEALAADSFLSIIERGSFKARMKDYYDAWMLAQVDPLETLADAVQALFAHRKAPVPSDIPPALTHDFATSDHARRLWADFVVRGKPAETLEFGDVVAAVRETWAGIQ